MLPPNSRPAASLVRILRPNSTAVVNWPDPMEAVRENSPAMRPNCTVTP